jgi:hypothetical protein
MGEIHNTFSIKPYQWAFGNRRARLGQGFSKVALEFSQPLAARLFFVDVSEKSGCRRFFLKHPEEFAACGSRQEKGYQLAFARRR